MFIFILNHAPILLGYCVEKLKFLCFIYFFGEKLKIEKSMIFSDVTFHEQNGYSEEKSPVTYYF